MSHYLQIKSISPMSSCPCCKTGNRSLIPFERILHRNSAGEAEYSERAPRYVRHAGQLKLLCSEIDFLLRFGGDEPCTVIYAGAAPGLHIPKLAEMFGHMRFVLIDPAESAIADSPRLQIVCARMTNELAAQMAETYGPNILFVSDVRVGSDDETRETGREHQMRVQADMDAQLGWHHVLNPIASILKFRLPWNLGPATTYLDGEICFPIFGRSLTHETRLIVRRGAKHIRYDNARYERQMAFFNQHCRPVVYESGRCFDCTSFRALVARFIVNEAEKKRKRGENAFNHGEHEAAVDAECEAIEHEMKRQGACWGARKKKQSWHRTLGRMTPRQHI